MTVWIIWGIIVLWAFIRFCVKTRCFWKTHPISKLESAAWSFLLEHTGMHLFSVLIAMEGLLAYKMGITWLMVSCAAAALLINVTRENTHTSECIWIGISNRPIIGGFAPLVCFVLLGLVGTHFALGLNWLDSICVSINVAIILVFVVRMIYAFVDYLIDCGRREIYARKMRQMEDDDEF